MATISNHLLILWTNLLSEYSVELDILINIINAGVLRPMSDMFK